LRALRWTLGLTLAATYGLIVLGAWVRATNSGLSCPDWPTCYGQWVVTPVDFAALGDVGYTYFQVMLEWVHRAIAGFIVGPLVLAAFVITLLHRRRRPDLVSWSVLLCVLLLIQAKLGGITVFDANSPWSVALHLGNALLVFAVMARLFVAAGPSPTATIGEAPRLVAGAAWAAAILTMVTAAMTAKSGASLACYTWPHCNGAWFPALDDPLVRVHFFHRALAAITGGLVLLLLWVGWRQGDPLIRKGLLALPALFAIQVVWGALVIVLHVPIWTAIVHQATGVALFLVLSYLLWLIRAAPRPALPKTEPDDVRLRHA
jgi:cytochrome c oxidase assembly protein subunit 15